MMTISKEKKSEYDRRRYLLNPKKYLKHTRDWHKNNLEKSRDHTRAWRARNPIRAKTLAREAARRRLSIPEGRMRHCVGQAKIRSRKAGTQFSITFRNLLPIPEFCPVFRIKLNYEYRSGRRGFINDSPSIDRINPLLGYIPGNVRIISWKANRVKCNSTIDDLRK